MTPDAENMQDLQDRLHVLEKENEALAERAEDITMLGLVAEQTGIGTDPVEMLASVLERVCILKAISYGACLEPAGPHLVATAHYHIRRDDELAADLFKLRDSASWPPAEAVVLDPADCGRMFEQFSIEGQAAAPPAAAVVPLPYTDHPGSCLLFVDHQRTPDEFRVMLPLIKRVADLIQARLDNLRLVARLERLNLNLDLEVAERIEDLRRSEARYRILFDHVPDAVLLVDADAEGSLGRIEDANEAAAAMYGYSREDLERLDIEALSAPGLGPRLESFEARVWRLQPGETVHEELQHRRKDGSVFPVEAIGTLVNLHGRQYLLAFARDITERKQTEQAMLKVQRTESVGVLAGGIAHDFNNLLTAIMGQTGIALELLGDQAPGRDNLVKAQSAATKAATLTQQMLAYSGRGKFDIQPLLLNDLIRENLQFLESAIPKQVSFVQDLDENLPPVTGDPSQLQQVVMNLVINGAESIGEAPGILSIRTRRLQLEQVDNREWPLSGNTLVPGEFVLVEVQDTGCGMTEEVRTRVFDPFFSTKPKGHGLGLSAVQGIIRAHRGGLAVQSEVGVGSTFRILLPVGYPESPARRPVPRSLAQGSRRTVLVIDDEDYMLEVVRDVLESHGHASLLALSGEQGIEMLGREPERIDLVLLDLTMPGLGGVETLRRLRKVTPGIPVVLSSGFAAEEALGQLKGLNLDGFLQKPYLAADLLRMVETLAPQVRPENG